MKSTARPLRTVLFVAGSEPDEVQASSGHGADAIVLDIEEPQTPYPPQVQARTRALVGEFLSSRPADADDPMWFVRVQPPSSGQMIGDLKAVMHPALGGILLPKTQTAADVIAADAILTNMEVESGKPRGSTVIYPILETAQALRNAYEIAAASDRVAYMGGAVSRFGDIYQALRFRWSAEGTETLFLRSKALVDARAAGIRYPVSGMWGGATDDHDGLRAWCEHLRDLGYFGMMIGDPSHVGIVHESFTPGADEITYWTELDRLATEAERTGEGPIVYGDPNQGEGFIVHIAHVGSARLGLEWARDLGVV